MGNRDILGPGPGWVALLAIAGCGASDGTSYLIDVSDEPPGTSCAEGGQRVRVGPDDNDDGILDDTEAATTTFVCDGGSGRSYLTRLAEEPAGERCPAGGTRIEVGPDLDGSGTLDDGEVETTTHVCNGTEGADGVAHLTEVNDEPAGANCPAGGVRIDAGPDSNGDGSLDSSETASTTYICNGTNGMDGIDSLTTVSNEPAGTNCDNGGLRIDTGPDTDDDGTLGASEIASTTYVCNGRDGADAVDHMTAVANEGPGANCPDGGVRIDSGPDADGNGTLDPSEIADTSYVCNGSNGTDGVSSLVDVTAEAPGANCPTGGVRIDSGPDADGNGTLEPEEITSTSYVCNGDPSATTTPVITLFNSSVASSTGEDVVLLDATINAPGSGAVVVIGTADAFCSSAMLGEGYDCDPSGSTTGRLAIDDTPDGAVTFRSFFGLAPDTTEVVTRSAAFAVDGAGSHTYYLRGLANQGEIGFWRRQLTVLFVPN